MLCDIAILDYLQARNSLVAGLGDPAYVLLFSMGGVPAAG